MIAPQKESTITSRIGRAFNQITDLRNPAKWLMQWLGPNESSAGIPINIQNALGVPEIWNAVSKVSGHVCNMPLECWRTDSNGKKTRDLSDPGARVWANPNAMNTSFEVVEKMMVDALLLGNGRLYIERNSIGQPIALHPIQSSQAYSVIVNGVRYHNVAISTATAVGPLVAEHHNGTMYTIHDDDVFYIMGLTTNGFWGENLLSIARDVIGLSIIGGESAGTLYQNVGRPGLILEAPKGAFPTKKDAQEFLDAFNEHHQGSKNAGKTAMVRENMKAIPLSLPVMDSSHVDMRQFQREASALLFLLEYTIGSDAGVYKGVAERNAAYQTNCLSRWNGKIEQQADKKLLSERKATTGEYGYTMNGSVLMRNNRESLALYTSSLRQQNIISGNEAREIHGLPPVEELEDDYNMNEATANPSDPNEEMMSDPNTTDPSDPDDSED